MPYERCLLLVDDEEGWCNLTAIRLRSAGWQVLVAYDGSDALKIYEENATLLSVVVSDLKMPGLQGEELLPLIRSRDEFIPLVAVTGAPDRAAHLRALTTGAYLYLEKPVDPDVFDRYLDHAHHLYELQKDIREARAQEERAARLFRQFVISDSLEQIVLSRRVGIGGLGLEIASFCFDTSKPGGDYVEWFSRGSEEVVFCLGDASGHGEVVCTLMACLSTIVLHRSHHLGRLGVEEMVSIIDETFLQLKDHGGIDSGKFMCLFVGAISLLSGRLVYVNAGHTDGFWVNKNGGEGDVPSIKRLKSQTGAAALYSEAIRKARPFTEQTVKLNPGDLLVVFTDGASEFLGKEQGGPSVGMNRLEAAVLEHYQPSASKTLERLIDWLKVEANSSTFEDDATLMVIRVLTTEETRVAAMRSGRGSVRVDELPI